MINRLTWNKEEISDSDIFDNRLFNVVVAGLPRTGTSMMSGIMERLGVNWLSNTDTEERKKKRAEDNKKRFGGTYEMNENFYEICSDSFNFNMRFLSEDYVGMKIILPINANRIKFLQFRPVKVIQMYRDPEEIRQSQQASYRQGLLQTEDEAETDRARYRSVLYDSTKLFNDLEIPYLTFQYRDVLADPQSKIEKIAAFINAPNPIDEAVNWVDPDRNRFKSEKITKNI